MRTHSKKPLTFFFFFWAFPFSKHQKIWILCHAWPFMLDHSQNVKLIGQPHLSFQGNLKEKNKIRCKMEHWLPPPSLTHTHNYNKSQSKVGPTGWSPWNSYMLSSPGGPPEWMIIEANQYNGLDFNIRPIKSNDTSSYSFNFSKI